MIYNSISINKETAIRHLYQAISYARQHPLLTTLPLLILALGAWQLWPKKDSAPKPEATNNPTVVDTERKVENTTPPPTKEEAPQETLIAIIQFALKEESANGGDSIQQRVNKLTLESAATLYAQCCDASKQKLVAKYFSTAQIIHLTHTLHLNFGFHQVFQQAFIQPDLKVKKLKDFFRQFADLGSLTLSEKHEFLTSTFPNPAYNTDVYKELQGMLIQNALNQKCDINVVYGLYKLSILEKLNQSQSIALLQGLMSQPEELKTVANAIVLKPLWASLGPELQRELAKVNSTASRLWKYDDFEKAKDLGKFQAARHLISEYVTDEQIKEAFLEHESLRPYMINFLKPLELTKLLNDEICLAHAKSCVTQKEWRPLQRKDRRLAES